MFTEYEIKNMVTEFGIKCDAIGKVIDTSIDDHDRRYNYLINKDYFLKINNSKVLDEKALIDIDQLIKNYISLGIYCPRLIKTQNGNFLCHIIKDGIEFNFYLEERSIYLTKNDNGKLDYEFKKEMLKHVGIFARRFTNKNLSDTRSMWTIIELAPSDEMIDEKQENFNYLIDCLKSNGHVQLVEKMIELNVKAREKIKLYMKKLPRCVFQGDLNHSNVLVDDDGLFKGLIDFNMFGTEVNINCFLNESMYYLTKEDFKHLSDVEIYDKMIEYQEELLSSIILSYKLNKDEIDIKNDYNAVIFTSFWPNVRLMIELLKSDVYGEKVVQLLNLICKRVNIQSISE